MEAIIKTVRSQLQQKREQLASLKEKITSLKEQAISIEKEEKELCDLLQSLTQNLETTSEPIETSTNTQKQPESVTSTSKTQQSSSPSPGEKEFMKREEDIEKILQNSSHGKQKWYVIFNGPFRAKLNAINRMKNVPTTSEREEMRRPSVENFQRLWDSLISYNNVHTTMMFYPKKRDTRPKAVFFPQASSKDVYEYFIHGLIDSYSFHGSHPKNYKNFPKKLEYHQSLHVFSLQKTEKYIGRCIQFPIFNTRKKLITINHNSTTRSKQPRLPIKGRQHGTHNTNT
ncbi:hypothetical protein Tco_0236169 [Tanacetum coccineum]